MKFENIDLVDALRRIMDIHTQNYKEDFELDTGLLHSLADSQSAEDKHLLWMSRPSGTYLLLEREVYVEDSFENKVWEYYHEQTGDPILAYAVEITGKEGGKVKGNLIELDYDAHVDRMQKLTVAVEKVAVTFEDEATFYLPFRSYRREAIPMEEKHGEIVSVNYLPENAKELDMILRRERFKLGFHAKTGNIEDHIHKLAVQHGVTEKLGVLPLDAQTAYNAVKEAHPEAIVCFAQNGYFEIYGEDAKKAAPLLGSKLLMKELEGGGQVAVTGFREDQWGAKAKDLWGQGNDVLVTQPGEDGKQEMVKHLRAEDYIPVGMVMDMDGKTVRVDSVDFPNEEVRLTDITDKQHPVQFWEKPSIVRGYVEDAPAENLWKAIDRREHGSRKKPSVLAKLKEHAQAAPENAVKKPERTKKPKSNEMEM
jgi:hypothetical protein